MVPSLLEAKDFETAVIVPLTRLVHKLPQKASGSLLRLDRLNDLWSLGRTRREPSECAENLSLCESVDEAENELAECLRMLPSPSSPIVIMEGSPLERGQDRAILQECAARLQSRNLWIVLGSGVGPEKKPQSPCERFLEDLPYDRRAKPGDCGFIGELIVSEMNKLGEVLEPAIRAQEAIASQGISKYPPILIRFETLETRRSSKRFAAVLQEIASLEDITGENVWLSGVLESLPPPYVSDFGKSIDSIVTGVFQGKQFGLIIGNFDPGAFDSIVFGLVKLIEYGFEDRLCLGAQILWRIDLAQFGGPGLVGGFQEIQNRLHEAGIPAKVIQKLSNDNMLHALRWFANPSPAKPPTKPKWKCDFCGKASSVKKQPFLRLDFRYCSMDCLRKHQEALDGDSQDNGGKHDGGGKRQGGTGGSGWGIAVGSV